MRIIILYTLCMFISGSLFAGKLKKGMYRGVLLIDSVNHIEIPFNFEVSKEHKKTVIIIHNAEERIKVDEISYNKDSVLIKMPGFDTEFHLKKNGKNLEGYWLNHYRKDYRIPFHATYKETQRFVVPTESPDPIFQGKWECYFSRGTKDEYKAIGVFHHLELSQLLTGTFLTETGDYRYLEGVKKGNELFLSCFDGSHAFLFTAKLADDTLTGMFYSGIHFKEPWMGFKNRNVQLRDPEEITTFKSNSAPINFSFKNTKGQMVSLNDDRYKNKAVIVQIMGSWCPNCMDESKYMNSIYNTYKEKGLEIISLAFEKSDDFEIAKKQVSRFIERFGISYEVLVTGLSGREKALSVFPGMTNMIAFPTTIFLDKNHQVVKVHAGFSGPATGKEYDTYKERTEALIQQLIK